MMYLKVSVNGTSDSSVLYISTPVTINMPSSDTDNTMIACRVMNNGAWNDHPGWVTIFDADNLKIDKSAADTSFTTSGNKAAIIDICIPIA
jgi:hypothetical protein